MTKRNIRRSEKRCRTVVKTSMCLLALIGAYMAAPTVYNKAEGLWQAHQEKQRAQIAKREAQIQERENQIKNQFDAELIAEIEMVEKNGALRYLSAHMAFENIYRKDVAALENGTMSQDEYRIRTQQYRKRVDQLEQMEKIELSKTGEHPFIRMIAQERQSEQVIVKNVSPQNRGLEYMR